MLRLLWKKQKLDELLAEARISTRAMTVITLAIIIFITIFHLSVLSGNVQNLRALIMVKQHRVFSLCAETNILLLVVLWAVR